MIEYVIPESPDDRVISKVSQTLNSGGLIAIPTDTNWSILADPFSKVAVAQLYKLKQAHKQKHYSLICSDIKMASEVAIIDNAAYRTLKRIVPGHFTFILEANKKISRAIAASKTDKEVGIRIIDNSIINTLLTAHNSALISTHIDPSLLDLDPEQPIYSYLIEEKLRGTIAMIVDPGEYEFVAASTIVDFTSSPYEIIRQGSGII